MIGTLTLLTTLALVGPGTIKMDGTDIPLSDMIFAGQVAPHYDGLAISGGRISFVADRQKMFDNKLSTVGTIALTLVDNSDGDTTALTLGQIRLVRKIGNWYLINLTGGQWRQVDLGYTVKGDTFRFGLVEDGTMVQAFVNGKAKGTATPYDSKTSQKITLGSPASEAHPWVGQIVDFDVVSRRFTEDDFARRYAAAEASVTPVQPVVPNPTPSNPLPNNPVPSNPVPSNPTPSNPGPNSNQQVTKQTTIEAELVNLTVVPEPKDVSPYRDALITHEYKVLTVKSGHLDKVDAGSIIRVARWGILASQKTSIANLKKGDRIELVLERYSDHPSLEHFFTKDELPDNFAAPFLYDVSQTAPGG